MILSLQAFAPAALLLGGGLLLLLRPGATLYVVIQVLTLVALLRLSQLAATAVTVPLYDPLADAPLQLRLDRLSLFFATAGVLAALLVSLPWVGDERRRLPFGWLALAQFGAVSAIMAGNLQGLAAGWGIAVAALLMMVVIPRPLGPQLSRPSQAATRNLVMHLAGAVVLLMGGMAVEAIAGTTSYDAIPIGAVDSRTGLLLAAAPVLTLTTVAGLVRLCRTAAAAALVLVAVMLPMSVYVLARTFDLAGGRPLPTPVATALTLAVGLGAAVWALNALWAPDLGAAVSRLLNALSLLLVGAFALGGATGLAALIVGFMSLQVVAGSTLSLTDAGGGRLPGHGVLPRAVLGGVGLVTLAGLGGLAVAGALDARLLELRRLVELGPAGFVLGIPLVLAMLATLVAAAAASRFGGGRLDDRRAALQGGLAVLATLALEAGAPVLRDLAVSLAAASAHVPPADVRSSASAAIPGGLLGITLELATVVAIALLVRRPTRYSAENGLRGAPDWLPPRLAVAPEIAVRAALRASSMRWSRFAAATGPGARFSALALAWIAAFVGVLVIGR